MQRETAKSTQKRPCCFLFLVYFFPFWRLSRHHTQYLSTAVILQHRVWQHVSLHVRKAACWHSSTQLIKREFIVAILFSVCVFCLCGFTYAHLGSWPQQGLTWTFQWIWGLWGLWEYYDPSNWSQASPVSKIYSVIPSYSLLFVNLHAQGFYKREVGLTKWQKAHRHILSLTAFSYLDWLWNIYLRCFGPNLNPFLWPVTNFKFSCTFSCLFSRVQPLFGGIIFVYWKQNQT